MKTIKLYGETLTTWSINEKTNAIKVHTSKEPYTRNNDEHRFQWEMAYTEYTADGSPVGEGTIDYTAATAPEMASYSIYTWDGKTMTKDGSKRRWVDSFYVTVAKEDRKYLPAIVKAWDSKIVEVSIRK